MKSVLKECTRIVLLVFSHPLYFYTYVCILALLLLYVESCMNWSVDVCILRFAIEMWNRRKSRI